MGLLKETVASGIEGDHNSINGIVYRAKEESSGPVHPIFIVVNLQRECDGHAPFPGDLLPTDPCPPGFSWPTATTLRTTRARTRLDPVGSPVLPAPSRFSIPCAYATEPSQKVRDRIAATPGMVRPFGAPAGIFYADAVNSAFVCLFISECLEYRNI